MIILLMVQNVRKQLGSICNNLVHQEVLAVFGPYFLPR